MTTKKLKEGYLTKAPDLTKGTAGLKKWKTRWFILYNDGELSYYESDKSHKPLGSFNLRECTEIFDAQSKTLHTHCLGLATEKRTYYIAAETKSEITEWLEVLEPFIYSLGAHRLSISSASLRRSYNHKEGWLFKQGELNKAWKERYFVLQDGKLIYYKDKKTDPPHGIIDLVGATVAASNGKREHAFDVTTPVRTYHIAAESKDNMLLWIEALEATCKSLDGRKRSSMQQDRISVCSSQASGILEESTVDDDLERISIHSTDDIRRSPNHDWGDNLTVGGGVKSSSAHNISHSQIEPEQVAHLKNTIAELRQELSLNRQEITDLKLLHEKELSSKATSLDREFQAAKKGQAELEVRNNELHTECEQYSKQTASLQQDIIHWKKQMAEAKNLHKEKETESKELNKKNEKLQHQLAEIERQSATLQEAEKNWHEKYKKSEHDNALIAESETTLRKTEKQQAELIKNYQTQVAELQKEMLAVKESKEQLQGSLVSCNDDSGELRETLTEYKSTVTELQMKVGSLQADNTMLAQKHQLELDSIKKRSDEYKRKIKELEKQLDPESNNPKTERTLSLLPQDSTDSFSLQNVEPSHEQEIESIKEQHAKELADLTARYETVVDGLKQECREMKQQLEKLALELSATPSRVEPKQFPILTDEVAIKELKANCNSLKQQLSTATSEKEEAEIRLREIETERDLLQNQLRKLLERLGTNGGTQSKVFENKLMASTTNHNEVNATQQLQHDTNHYHQQQPPKPKRPPKDLIQHSRGQQKSNGFLHSLFGI